MRVPLSWLREYVDVPVDAAPEDVLEALVRVGFEEEDVHRFDLQGPIVVGEVLEFVDEPQSNGKTIRWCQVRVAPDGETAADGGDAVHGIAAVGRRLTVGRDAHPAPADRLAVGLRLLDELEHLAHDDGTAELEVVHVLLFEADAHESLVQRPSRRTGNKVDVLRQPAQGNSHD